MSAPSPKTGILLLNLGGPDRPEAVKPFLYNLFSDPDIIKLPFSWLMQRPLAWYIASLRAHESRENYKLMGGGSPILPYTQEQGEALKSELARRGQNVGIYIAMRYWHPFTQEAVAQMRADGIERLIVVPLYPHFSYTTTGSSLNELARVMRKMRWRPSDIAVVPAYYDAPLYLQAVAETIRQAMDAHAWGCAPEQIQLLFSAHSLPLKHIKRTGDPYPDQIYESARKIAESYFPQNAWELAYQSQVPGMKWLGPPTPGALHYFAGKNMDNILIIPVSFVSEHVETLVEIDRQFLPEAAEIGLQYCHRAPALNTSPTFIGLLADLVEAQLASASPRRALPSLNELMQSRVAG